MIRAIAEQRAAGIAASIAARPIGLVNAAELAAILGVSRGYVYAHARDLNAIRLGSTPKAPLRFDPVAVLAALQAANAPEPPTRRSSPRRRSAAGSILQVRPRDDRDTFVEHAP